MLATELWCQQVLPSDVRACTQSHFSREFAETNDRLLRNYTHLTWTFTEKTSLGDQEFHVDEVVARNG